jgi:outer membrane protein with beta-barrel domain
MKLRGLLISVILLLALSISAYAQDDDEDDYKWRNFELNIVGGLSLPSGGTSDWYDSLGAKTGFNVGLSGAYFLTNNIGIGAYFTYTRFGVDDAKIENNLSHHLYDAGLYFKYAFTGESSWEPYLRLNAGVLFPKFATWVGEEKTQLRELSYDPALSLGIYAGLMFYTSDYGGVYLEAGYHNDITDGIKGEYASEKLNFNDNTNYIEIRGGVSVYFGPE